MTSYKEGIPCVFIIMCFPVFVLQDFSGDLSDLDGVVQQRRQEMMESSSSGSQTPDYDKMTGVCLFNGTL